MRSNSANILRVEALRREIVAGGVDVRGVEANAEAFRFAHVVDDVGDLLELVAEARALAGGRLERDLRFHFRQDGVHGVDRADDFVEAGLLARAEMRAGMHDEEWQLELIGACQFFGERAK